MERFVKGDVVVIPFPFSDLSGSKRRPALVISNLEGNDLILCQITSKNIKDDYAIELKDDDIAKLIDSVPPLVKIISEGSQFIKEATLLLAFSTANFVFTP